MINPKGEPSDEKKYGKRLTVEEECHNGSTALENAYEEALNQVCYLKKAIEDEKMNIVSNALSWIDSKFPFKRGSCA